VEEELTAKACANARRNAEQMAQGLAVELGSVFAISEDASAFADPWGAFTDRWDSRDVKFDIANDSKDSFFVPSTITFGKSVNVLFKIKTED
jgi:hypothetical protein